MSVSGVAIRALVAAAILCLAHAPVVAAGADTGPEVDSRVESEGDGGGEVVESCPVQNPCDGETCVEGANCTDTDTGKTACVDGDKIQRCIGGQTIHVKECSPCSLAACCGEPGGCSCLSASCGNSARWYCADNSEAE